MCFLILHWLDVQGWVERNIGACTKSEISGICLSCFLVFMLVNPYVSEISVTSVFFWTSPHFYESRPRLCWRSIGGLVLFSALWSSCCLIHPFYSQVTYIKKIKPIKRCYFFILFVCLRLIVFNSTVVYFLLFTTCHVFH